MMLDVQGLRRWCKQEAKRMKRQEDAAIFHASAGTMRALYRGERLAFNTVIKRLDALIASQNTGKAP